MLTSFIFPAFVPEYSGDEPEILRRYSGRFDSLLEQASDYTGIDLTLFNTGHYHFHGDELATQYLSYIFGCTLSDLMKNRKIIPDFIAGYSMGIYAALYCGQSVTFNGGLDLIRKAFELIRESVGKKETGMGSIVGLSEEDLKLLMAGKKNINLANTNGLFAHLISGLVKEVRTVTEKAKIEGALHASVMNVTCPYHTSLLNDASVKFKEYLHQHALVGNSAFVIVSGIDQRSFSISSEIIHELVNNLNTSVNWYLTMQRMLKLGVSRFVECGAGTSLNKIGKFIRGNFTITTLYKIDGLIG